MATKIVLYITDNCLPCSCKGTVNVIMCTIYGQTVPGQIIESASATSSCSNGSWQYQISYDSDDLPEGVTALATSDITSVACEGCLVTWIREHDNYTVTESDHGAGASLIGLADEQEVERLTLSIENPSLHKSMKGLIHWNWVLEVSGTDDISGAANSELEIDGVSQGNSGSAQWSEQVPGGIDFFRAIGAVGFQELTIAPGETVEVELVITNNGTASGSTASVGNANLAFQGSTTA